jgi:hypothetical protein
MPVHLLLVWAGGSWTACWRQHIACAADCKNKSSNSNNRSVHGGHSCSLQLRVCFGIFTSHGTSTCCSAAQRQSTKIHAAAVDKVIIR